MELNIRLQILKDAGQISDVNYKSMIKIIELFKEKYEIELNEENGAMFITHFSIAYERILKDEIVNEISHEIYKEVVSSKSFTKSQKVLIDIEEELKFKIPEVEKKYLMIYLCLLFDNQIKKIT